MMDFQNAVFARLRSASEADFSEKLTPMLVPGEQIVQVFKGGREGVIFTNKRILAVDVHGLAGKKTGLTSLPYSRIQAYTVETAGVLDPDGLLDLWVSVVGRVRFEFASGEDISRICRIISEYTL